MLILRNRSHERWGRREGDKSSKFTSFWGTNGTKSGVKLGKKVPFSLKITLEILFRVESERNRPDLLTLTYQIARFRGPKSLFRAIFGTKIGA